ncbi:NAD-P-binding protein [Hysterangium stoloniferum]|nr:NAD-P-binding protein [Hysterangium stoloniferum]
MASSDGHGVLLKSDSIAASFRKEVLAGLGELSQPPTLVGILSTNSKPSKFYAEFTQKTCEELGFKFILKMVGSAAQSSLADGEGVEEAIIEANEDDAINGIMVYYPIYGGQQDHYLQQIVSPYKDVEGLHFKFHYNLYHNIRFIDPESLSLSSPHGLQPIDHASEVPPEGTVKSIIPCTPLAIVKSLEHCGVYNSLLKYGDRAYGRTVTVINRSEVVGRPLAALLANDGARVFSVDIDSIQEYNKRPVSVKADLKAARYNPRHVVHPSTLTLPECLAQSDVVISAVPSAQYKVKTEHLKVGCICLNISAEKNFEKDIREKASIYLPSVGKVTILMLLRNL